MNSTNLYSFSCQLGSQLDNRDYQSSIASQIVEMAIQVNYEMHKVMREIVPRPASGHVPLVKKTHYLNSSSGAASTPSNSRKL